MCELLLSLGHLYKFAEGALAALQSSSKCSLTLCKLRFFARLRLAIIALIEFIEVPFISRAVRRTDLARFSLGMLASEH
jgi:hypothetical protein